MYAVFAPTAAIQSRTFVSVPYLLCAMQSSKLALNVAFFAGHQNFHHPKSGKSQECPERPSISAGPDGGGKTTIIADTLIETNTVNSIDRQAWLTWGLG